MSSSCEAPLSAPTIRISRASPDTGEEETSKRHQDEHHKTPPSVPRRTKSLPSRAYKKRGRTQLELKRSATTANSTKQDKHLDMSSEISRDSPSSPRSRYRSGASTKKARIGSQDIDWTEVTDPEERRRIQNRIAQRKFREKARDNRERSERESRNRENAGNSYRVPLPGDIDTSSDLPGLPWGGVNLNHVVFRGHDAESRRSGSGRDTTCVGEESYSLGTYQSAHGQGYPQTASFGSSGAGDESYYDQAAYLYDPALQAYTPR